MVETVKLASGGLMPQLGLGTWQSAPGEVFQAVKSAINIGYRHLDCAFVYKNEHEIGNALSEKFRDGTIRREDIFITSKLWVTYLRPELVREGCVKTLSNLKLEYLDLYLIHAPTALKPSEAILPMNDSGEVLIDDVDYVDTWKAMEKLVDEGLCKSIGVSNFNEKQLDRILSTAKHPVSVHQIECHPYLTQQKMRTFCKSKNIVVTAYSPLGSPGAPLKNKDTVPRPLDDPVVTAIAESHGKSPGQVLIRYQIQTGNVVIPKSAKEHRIRENFAVFDFTLSEDDMARLNGLDRNYRVLGFDMLTNHPNYPFESRL